ncbi:hypothetical protein PENDEC_c004G04891 [Penicillium decumbens]|uniref:LysM domain-containing protein n=1 Tax=Penicillium decumbens TaxID=69771 RepID=A0A1V6PHS8_PENDC|nr:hypothetical protein PENDEC_c004G04891 [Penicillium decumbens]
MISNIRLMYLLHAAVATTVVAASGHGWTNGPTATGPTDVGLTTSCDYFANDVASRDTCEMVEDYFGITETQFENWNPALKDSSTCKMITGNSYCVSGPDRVSTSAVASATPATTLTISGSAAPVQTGITKSCTKYHKVVNGDTCYSIQDQYLDFTLAQFYAWNPAISMGCKGLVEGDYVCVQTNGSGTSTSTSASSSVSSLPTQSGVTSKCNKWHYVSGNDTCQSILSEFDLTKAQFYDWNPATGANCTNLWFEVDVCVGVPGFTPSPTTTAATATATETGLTPSPVQSGIASDCTKYYKVVKGDNCQTVEKTYDITSTNFLKWNPAVGSDCSDLEVNVYYCVAV